MRTFCMDAQLLREEKSFFAVHYQVWHQSEQPTLHTIAQSSTKSQYSNSAAYGGPASSKEIHTYINNYFVLRDTV